MPSTPATVNFGRVAVGERSSRVVEIANVGNADFEIHQLRSTSAEFTAHTAIHADSRFLLPPNNQRTLPLDVTFSPFARGEISGALRLDGQGANETMTLDVLLKGRGVAPEIELNPAGIVDFGYSVLGEQAERTFVASNVGAPQSISQLLEADQCSQFEDCRSAGSPVANRETGILAQARSLLHCHERHGFRCVCPIRRIGGFLYGISQRAVATAH